MEVLNAAGLAPIAIPKIPSSFEKRVELKRPLIPFKPLRTSASIFRGLGEGFAALSSVFHVAGSVNALTYEEALSQTIVPSDFNFRFTIDWLLRFASEKPLISSVVAASVAVPLILLPVLGSSKAWGVESAKNAFSKLAEDASAQLLDIRERKEFKEVGSPDVRALKKKVVAIPFRSDDKEGFLKKLNAKLNDPKNTTLFVLDKFDGNSKLVAELVTANGFKAAFAIKDGAEGARGWMNSGLPWSSPNKAFFYFDELKDAITGSVGETSDGLSLTLGIAAATGLGFLAFTETETLLQLVGSAAIIQFIAKKLLFAEDRKVTLQQLDEFLNKKVAPKEFFNEIKSIGKGLPPESSQSQPSLSAPADSTTETSPSATPAQVAASVAETKGELDVASSKSTPAVNSVLITQVDERPDTVWPQPLSPYPKYHDLKPPSSPSPSQP
ncbi:hypothetical protein HPP92_008476 [Vanilla planifolia]|uniref:Protein THYLAKOID RHODANESE-LIKE, chloroplastic n=1 Tax=Vanilla planifolia TaxID=51239 RepID=A0A835R628_VANPL|nr:hypothetical protein HPP92_008635 [Vanilla planifolia]KAG0486381.1 hypothetical protein HPP92_008476 [Vanilla planifolia]